MTHNTHAASAYCREVTKHHAKNFYYAFLFLPLPKRQAIYAVYAFCRYCDDIADEEHINTSPQTLLTEWRLELDRCYAGKPTHIITQALRPVITTYAIPKHYFNELIDGVEMDLSIQRYPTFTELEQYCYRVASVVGLICIETFGYTHPGVQVYARQIGVALQLTNIIRDIKEDAERGRIYLPIEDLQAFKYPETALLQHQFTPEFVDLMSFQARRAIEYYHKAQAALLPGDKARLIAPEIMAAIYRATLRKIIRRRYNVFKGRVSLSTARKILIALGTFLKIWLAARLLPLQKSSTTRP
ncbi:MAG: presqualene diphosphate synthase HpnD [bacterium]|nr:presqualene diphosphate synthase HpnD [bacterium]